MRLESLPPEVPSATSRARVLVVDDVAANRFRYRAVLEDDWHDITEAADGVRAADTAPGESLA